MSEIFKKNIFQIVFLLFFAAVFFFHEIASNPWMYLNGLGLILSLLLFKEKQFTWPDQRIRSILLFTFFVFILTSFLNSSHFVEERWLMRYTFIFLFFVFILLFKTEEELINYFKLPFLIFCAFICFESLYQYYFNYSADNKLSHSAHASRFWNIALYSQAMLLTLPLISFFKQKSSTAQQKIYDLLIVLISVSLLVGFSRSVLIGLVLFFLIEIYKSSDSKRKIKVFFLLLAALAISTLSNSYKNGSSTSYTESKVKSLNYRYTVWNKTLDMIKDNPTGVGTNNFMFHLFAYTDGDVISDRIGDTYYSPHSEFLRVFAEEGFGSGLLYCFLTLCILATSLYQIFIKKTFHPFYTFYICLFPEIIFQFPSENYMPTLLFALLSACLINQSFKEKKNLSFAIKSLVVTAISLNLFFWVIRNEKIIPNTYGDSFCSLFHDDWLLCRRYFSEFYIKNDFENAEKILRPIIKRQPFNYNFISLDYSFGREPQSQVLACMYFNLFNGQNKISDSSTEKCQLEKDKSKMREFFFDYAEKR